MQVDLASCRAALDAVSLRRVSTLSAATESVRGRPAHPSPSARATRGMARLSP